MPHTHDVAKEIKDVIRLSQTGAFSPDTPVYYVLATWFCELGEAVHAVASSYREDDLDKLVLPTTEAALNIWDTMIVPIDFPQIPNYFETTIEAQVRSMIPPLVAAAFTRLKISLQKNEVKPQATN